jgi:hypothetical protein
MNTDKKGIGFIGVYRCSSVANNVLPRPLQTEEGLQNSANRLLARAAHLIQC